MRNAHPNLYKAYFAYAVLSIALGLNFIFLTPAFMPLDIPKWPIGLTLLGCGASKMTLLLLDSHTKWLRLSLALSVAIYSFWGAALAFDFFRLHQTSLQLPLCYTGLATLGYLLVMEPFTNPATEKPEA